MPSLEVESCRMNRGILALYANDKLYVRSGHALVTFDIGETLYKHARSIRCITGDSKVIGCCSYELQQFWTVRHRLVERIEGPKTKMKGMAIEGDYIAITTRGRTVWILENLKISKILDDHLHDVKGCCFYERRLYSWSYDNTIKMYELFHLDHSWELAQSIDLSSIVWNVVFLDRKMYAMLHDGRIVRLCMKGAQWCVERDVLLSAYPLMTSCVANGCIAAVCNHNCLVILDQGLGILSETLLSRRDSGAEDRHDIFSCCYWRTKNAVVCGSKDDVLYTVHLPFPDG